MVYFVSQDVKKLVLFKKNKRSKFFSNNNATLELERQIALFLRQLKKLFLVSLVQKEGFTI